MRGGVPVLARSKTTEWDTAPALTAGSASCGPTYLSISNLVTGVGYQVDRISTCTATKEGENLGETKAGGVKKPAGLVVLH